MKSDELSFSKLWEKYRKDIEETREAKKQQAPLISIGSVGGHVVIMGETSADGIAALLRDKKE